MKTVVVALLSTVLSVSAFAKSNNVIFKAVDQTVETQTCLVAADQGLKSAKAFVQAQGQRFDPLTSCNGLPIKSFAKKFQQVAAPAVTEVNAIEYRFKAADQATESQICAMAALNGLDAVKGQVRNLDDIYCNGRILAKFVRAYRS